MTDSPTAAEIIKKDNLLKSLLGLVILLLLALAVAIGAASGGRPDAGPAVPAEVKAALATPGMGRAGDWFVVVYGALGDPVRCWRAPDAVSVYEDSHFSYWTDPDTGAEIKLQDTPRAIVQTQTMSGEAEARLLGVEASKCRNGTYRK